MGGRCVLGAVATVILALLFACAEACAADTVRIGIGFSIPPYVLKDQDRGLEVDIVRRALALVGYDTRFVYLPNLRLPLAFAKGEVDGVAVNESFDVGLETGHPAFGSNATVSFRNFAITLASRGFSLADEEDLESLRVLGFSNACKYLGPCFAAMAATNPRYEELADQSLQVRMLYAGRVDVVVADIRVFNYWRTQLLRGGGDYCINFRGKLDWWPIFPVAPRQVVFADEQLRDRFNLGLAWLRTSGEYQVVVRSYQNMGVLDRN